MQAGTLTITVETGNAAFADPLELPAVLARIAQRVEDGRPGPVSDSNGNTVATWGFRPDPTDVDLTDVDTVSEALERAGIGWVARTSPVDAPVHERARRADPDGTSWTVTLTAPVREPLHVDYWTGSRVEDVPDGPAVVAGLLLDARFLADEPMEAVQGLSREDVDGIDTRDGWLRDVFGDGYGRLLELVDDDETL